MKNLCQALDQSSYYYQCVYAHVSITKPYNLMVTGN